MTAEQFAYWLQGFAELNQQAPSAEQWKSIQEHLQTVFNKVTPPVQIPRGYESPLKDAVSPNLPQLPDWLTQPQPGTLTC